MRILIANRGEIARRIIRTARAHGHITIAVYGDPDADAPFVSEADAAYRLGGASLADSYLNQARLLEAISATEADAVHPGYGFLAENAAFAHAIEAAGKIWIGPHPEAIERMGSKIEARRIAAGVGVPIIPGFDESQDPDDLAAAADRIGYPVLVKAAAGGGGKGIRIVHAASDFAAALEEASNEATHNFGDGTMIVERYIARPRHIEVQIIGDRHGHVVHLGTRECSVQRRYQKVLEEAPAPNLSAVTRAGMQDAAVKLATAMGYDSAGTVEYVVDAVTDEYFFLEMNTRLQVEHPVTEEVTGFDLVELMITVAQGHPLPFSQEQIAFSGHAFECRINAEDPNMGFSPQIGTIERLDVGYVGDTPPTGRFRFDAAVRQGDAVTPFYDSMIAKLIVWDADRSAALGTLGRWLAGTRIDGLATTLEFHRWLVAQPAIVDASVTTRFLDETPIPADPAPAVAPAAAAWRRAPLRGYQRGRPRRQSESTPFESLADWRLTPHRPSVPVGLAATDGTVYEADPEPIADSSSVQVPVDVPGQVSGQVPVEVLVDVSVADRTITVVIDSYPHRFTVLDRAEAWAPTTSRAGSHTGDIVAPFPGIVTEVFVRAGDRVVAGDRCVVIEAMKMLHTLTAPTDGTVAEVPIAAGDQVAGSTVLVRFEAADADSPTTSPPN